MPLGISIPEVFKLFGEHLPLHFRAHFFLCRIDHLILEVVFLTKNHLYGPRKVPFNNQFPYWELY